jgi:hypothetical protein
MTTAPQEPGSDPDIVPSGEPDQTPLDPIAPGDPEEPNPPAPIEPNETDKPD